MIAISEIKKGISSIAKEMAENRDYLVELDQRNGDGDLGISMSEGFNALVDVLNMTEEMDLGKVFRDLSKTFNESAPSSLGTILSFGLMGIAKELKGKTEVSRQEFSVALEKGLDNILDKTGSKVGEKTIIDSLSPGIESLLSSGSEEDKAAFQNAYEASKAGAEKTKEMMAVHGRAAYYGEKSLGLVDGGAVVGTLIFKGMATE